MAGFCNIVISGNLTRKPELKKTPSGLDVTELNVAVSTYKKGAPDNQLTTFYRASIFGVRAGNAAKYLDKGSSVIVSGQNLTINTYTKQDGSGGASPEFIADSWTFAGRRNEDGGSFSAPATEESGFSSGAATPSGKGKAKSADVAPIDIDNTINLDDIPF